MQSKNLKAFNHLREHGKDKFILFGDMMIVEEIPEKEMRTASGLFLATGGAKRHDGLEMNKPLFCKVLMKGDGYVDDDGKDVPPKCNVGDTVLIPILSVHWFSVFGALISESGSRIGWTRETEVKGLFNDYEGTMKLLEEGLKNVQS